MKKFETKYLDELDKVVKAKDAGKFEAVYKETIKGCNDCHVKSTGAKGSGFTNYKFIKVQIPTTDPSGGLQDYVAK